MQRLFNLVWFAFLIGLPAAARVQDPIMYWDFEKTENKTSIEIVSGTTDVLEGNFENAPGVRGTGLRFDGFTTVLRHSLENTAGPGDAFTIEAWVALGSYPWNWCPILTTESSEVRGYRLMLGPLGEVSLQGAIGEQWISCTSEQEVMPLRTWMHIVGIYKAEESLELYLNGRRIAACPVQEKITYARRSECRIGMVAFPGKPSDIHRTWGTVAAYYGIDGIMDEIKVYDQALSAKQIASEFQGTKIMKADIMPRKLPKIEKHPGRFGAFYTKLNYYPGWDNLWPVERDPDIVVCFERSPIKVIFWRGIRYAASWVSENENWMTDQSVEAWEDGDKDREGCFEHMQDRHCRFSHVRIIENTPARVVVHWRYAPVSAYDNTWRPDEKTGWECWIDEYYFLYPDGTGIRRVSWKKGSLGEPRQFQETLALLHPGQKVSDLVDKDVTFVSDYEGNQSKMMFVEDPNSPPYGPFNWDNGKPFTIQQYNFKSENKPFICFEPGNVMHLRHNSLSSYDRASGCNHFPVGQARCDGRTTRMSDRPSHATSFPISDPVIHEDGYRFYWCGLYGMNTMDIDQIVRFGRSWAFAPELSISGSGADSQGYDRSRRCYQIQKTSNQTIPIEFTVEGSGESPLINPAFSVKNWNAEGVKVFVNGEECEDCETGIHHKLEGSDLMIFLWVKGESKITVRLEPVI